MKEAIDNKSKLKERALNVSLKEGAVNSFSTGISDTYITPLALALKANTVHIGIFSSLVGIISPIAQYISTHLMQRHSRKNIAISFGILQGFLWLPIALLAYLSWRGIAQESLIPVLIVIYVLIAAAGGFGYAAWFSWMGDLIPEEIRGKYFGRRNMINGGISMIAVILGAFILDAFKTRGFALLGFVIIFSIATISRFISVFYLKKQYCPQFKQKKKDFFSLLDFVKRFDNFGKFATFHALFNLALMIASPFYAVYMLEELKFNYITFMTVTLSSTIFYILFSPIVGKLADKYGNRKAFILGSFLLSLNPFLWMVLKTPLSLIFIPQILVGLANALLGVSITNFTLDSVKQEHRSICISYTNILYGIGTFIGALLGGVIIKYGSIGIFESFMLVFLISGIFRLLTSVLVLPHIKEVRKVKRFSVIPALHHMHPFKFVHNHFESFAHYTHFKHSQGLKIWNPYFLYAIRKKQR